MQPNHLPPMTQHDDRKPIGYALTDRALALLGVLADELRDHRDDQENDR